MNKGELIEAVATKTGCKKTEAEKIIDAVIDSITEGLRQDGSVALMGFGSFMLKKRAARTGRNPQTGETISIKASTTVGFKPAKNLKSAF